LSWSLASAGEEALRTVAAEQDMEAIAHTLEAAAASASGGEATNLRTQSVPALARVEAAAEAEGLDEVASAALAGWALASYTATHFEDPASLVRLEHHAVRAKPK
jgi:hypothetical protein